MWCKGIWSTLRESIISWATVQVQKKKRPKLRFVSPREKHIIRVSPFGNYLRNCFFFYQTLVQQPADQEVNILMFIWVGGNIVITYCAIANVHLVQYPIHPTGKVITYPPFLGYLVSCLALVPATVLFLLLRFPSALRWSPSCWNSESKPVAALLAGGTSAGFTISSTSASSSPSSSPTLPGSSPSPR